ncbi:MAG: prepilin peptidase, partial [bacterium]|nr:prepilin peptidase [bacterium]
MVDTIFLIFNIFVFLFGLCIGSFLNCFIYRLGKKEKITGRSYCPKCSNQLKWYDLFPVFSFVFLRGKCRDCHKKISIQYPLVEIFTALIFLLVFNKFSVIPNLIGNPGFKFWIPAFAGMTAYLIFLFYTACSLIVIFVYDLKHYLIPDKVLFPAILLALIFSFQNTSYFINSLLAVAVASGFFLTIFLVSGGRWMGFGDVKLAILMGLLLGLPNVLAALFIAFFFGAIISIVLIIFGKKGLKSEIPFGPFLIAGT